jgi:hypothetical protein
MQFDVILTNPPFQDSVSRGKTPHKLWIDFTQLVFDSLLKSDGVLCQVSPSSFRSPSNNILTLMKSHTTEYINLETSKFFPGVGSTFADYAITKKRNRNQATKIYTEGSITSISLDDSVFYLPNDFCATSFSIHKKVIFSSARKLGVRWDYVTCHNIRLRRDQTLSREETTTHKYPVFHTNRQIWWSSIRQDWADKKKVMWTRSGYTIPFFDDGKLGGTDMAYFVLVETESEGKALEHNLNLKLLRFIFMTAKWSGFGNEKVFSALPDLPRDFLTDSEMFELFDLDEEEIAYVNSSLE